MSDYTVEHAPLHYGGQFKILQLKRDEIVLAELKYAPNTIHRIEGKPSPAFTRRYDRTPATELLMHAAFHSKRNDDGSVTLRYEEPLPAGKRMLARAEKQGCSPTCSHRFWKRL